MFNYEHDQDAPAPARVGTPLLRGAALGIGYGTVAGLCYAVSVGLIALLLGLGDGIFAAASFAGLFTLVAAAIAATVGAVLGLVCGTLVALVAPSARPGLGGRAAVALLATVSIGVVLLATVTGAGAAELVVTMVVLVAWPAVFAVPALLLHVRAITRRVHGGLA